MKQSKGSLESVLLKTSAATDIQSSGGTIFITGLKPISLKDITAVKQIKSRAEVVQVITVGGTSYTPTSYTTYTVSVFDPNRTQAGYQESRKEFSYTTGVVTGTAATDRETIHAALVVKINADASCHATAASLGSGTGFTVTDAGGYYPVFAQNQTNIKGANLVFTSSNADGSGFSSTNFTTTTAAVISYGIGAKLATEAPVLDFVYGNLISGVLDAPPATFTNPPTYAVSGQNYDGFAIESLVQVAAYGGVNQFAYITKVSTAYVDNGTGTSTSNLAGFKAFERQFHIVASKLYRNDINSVIQFFDAPIVFQDPLGAAPTGTANTLGWILSPTGSMNKTNIGTATVVSPVLDSTGLNLDQDNTATEGAHYSANQQTLGAQQFVVGSQEFSLTARVVLGDWTDAAFMVGFRRKAVYDSVINNYTDYATIGNGSSAAGTTWINGDLFVTRAALNGGSTTQAISAVAPTDAVSVQLIVKVAINGTVTAYVDGVSYPIYSTGTTAMVFDSGDIMIPFFQYVNIGGGDPDVSISEFFAIAEKDFVVTAA